MVVGDGYRFGRANQSGTDEHSTRRRDRLMDATRQPDDITATIRVSALIIIADNLPYVKLKELYGRSPHIERIRVTVQASARTSSELHISSVSAASPSGMAPLDRPHS